MADDMAPAPPEGASPPRVSWMSSAGAAFAHMRASSVTEYKRGEDKPSAWALPLSCVLLFAAIVLPAIPAVKAAAFVLPIAAFTFYIMARLGIVSTFNSRQAYLTWHILIATFLLGGSFSLFMLYVALFFARSSVSN